jgi:hypothetical protein
MPVMVVYLPRKSPSGVHYGSGCQHNPSYCVGENRVGARLGSVAMEYFVHQQNLAHYRRLLADTELATSKDEIRHSMLMRLLAEEEAKELLMPVSGDALI